MVLTNLFVLTNLWPCAVTLTFDLADRVPGWSTEVSRSLPCSGDVQVGPWVHLATGTLCGLSVAWMMMMMMMMMMTMHTNTLHPQLSVPIPPLWLSPWHFDDNTTSECCDWDVFWWKAPLPLPPCRIRAAESLSRFVITSLDIPAEMKHVHTALPSMSSCVYLSEDLQSLLGTTNLLISFNLLSWKKMEELRKVLRYNHWCVCVVFF